MFGFAKALICSTLLLGALSSPTRPKHDDTIVNWDEFNAILDTVDPAALHRVLHQFAPKFQDGIFSRDRSAIEHVHSEDPTFASKLVHIAKRQDNSTVTTSAEPTTTATPSTPAESSILSSQQAVSSSEASSVSSILSSAIFASTVPAETTILVAPSAPESATAIATTEGAVAYSTVGGGVVTVTSSAVGVRFTPSTSIALVTATRADGTLETRTSVVVVNAPITGSAATDAAGAAATGTSNPSLQNAATSSQVGVLMTVVVALSAVVFAL